MMKMPWPLLASVLAFAPVSARAHLGLTADQCRMEYGRPTRAADTFEVRPPARNRYDYHGWRGLYINALFVGRDVADSVCASITYQHQSNLTPNGPIQELTAREIEDLLEHNAGGSQWERRPSGWRRKDGRAFAMEFRYGINGHPCNSLTIFTGAFDPKKAVEIAAVPAPK